MMESDMRARLADLSPVDQEYMDGYRDGGDPDAPEPNSNRHEAYRHSFAVRRAEIAGRTIRAEISRARAAAIDARAMLSTITKEG